MGKDAIEYLGGEWGVISQAPVIFFVALAILATAIWFALHWQFGARLTLRDDAIADYRRKLDGATPDEAADRIARLEKRLNSLTPIPIEDLQKGLKDAEAVARQNQIRELVDRYLETHTEPPPDQWINGELEKLGVSWRVVNKQTHYETFEAARWG